MALEDNWLSLYPSIRVAVVVDAAARRLQKERVEQLLNVIPCDFVNEWDNILAYTKT